MISSRHILCIFLYLCIIGASCAKPFETRSNTSITTRSHSFSTKPRGQKQNLAFAFPNPIAIIDRDFKALTRKVTAYHILLPKSDEVAISLKQKIRNKVNPAQDSNQEPMYVLDAFKAAARKFSQDEETAVRDGLLGTLVPQGYCRAKELDEACFQVPLGVISGPIESEYGYHLLLVEERTNCPKLDGNFNKIIKGSDGCSTVFTNDSEKSNEVAKVAMQQVGFWVAVSLAGGVVAEISAKAATVITKLPWE